MWRKDDLKSQELPDISTQAVNSTNPLPDSAPASREHSSQPAISPGAIACISQGIKIHGEIAGSEDLFLDGELNGKLDLAGASLTIGPNGRVKADVNAREVIVRGYLIGKVAGKDRVQIWNAGRVEGEIRTERLVIEDGAVLRGKVETGKPAEKSASPVQAETIRLVEKPETVISPALPVAPAGD
jgi:cytoskeletal protein CcmA (bactofilin family)